MHVYFYENMTFSVHLEKFPKLASISVNNDIVKEMDKVREICNCVSSLRKDANIRTRMPLKKVTICGNSDLRDEYLSLIKQEVNVHEIELFNGDLNKITKKEIVLDMKECGKIFGSKLKDILIAQKEGKWEIIDEKLSIAGVELDDSLFSVSYKTANGIKAMHCKNFNLLVMIDTEISKDLIIEGLARDIIRVVQQTRKDNNLAISDRINVILETKDKIFSEVLSQWKDYICNQTLALNFEIKDTNNINNSKIINVDEYNFSISVEKVIS